MHVDPIIVDMLSSLNSIVMIIPEGLSTFAQPLDLLTIRQFKQNYRKMRYEKLVNEIIDKITNETLIKMVSESWKKVTKQSVKKSFEMIWLFKD